MTSRALVVVVAAACAGCFGTPSVTRIVDGETVEGRYVEPEAYAASLRAELLAAAGKPQEALAEFERARAADPESPALHTRVAELRCELAPPGSEAASDAIGDFDRALDHDPTYAPAWRGLARCLERQGDRERALSAAELAVSYDPLDARSSESVSRLLFALGRTEQAWLWLDSLSVLRPRSREVAELLLDAALRHGDLERARAARRTLAALTPGKSAVPGRALDEALARGDLERARELGLRAGKRPGELALLLLPSAPERALEQASLVFDADPSDSDAFIALLVAADRTGNEERFHAALALLDKEPLPPSPLGLLLLRQLLERRSGSEAARALLLPSPNAGAGAQGSPSQRKP